MEALERTLDNIKAGRDPREAPASGELADLSREELYERAQAEGGRGRSKMDRDELLEALSSS